MSAFEEGAAAFFSGKPVADNPYRSGNAPLKFYEWACGWYKMAHDMRTGAPG